MAAAVLPKNTNDGAVDLLTRQYLYAKGLDYRHGTGHGIGSYLKVKTYHRYSKVSIISTVLLNVLV